MSEQTPNQRNLSSRPSDMRLRILTALAFIPVVYFLLQGGMVAIMICLVIGAAMSYEAVTVSGHGFRHPIGIAQFVMLMLPALMTALPAGMAGVVSPIYVLLVMMVALAVSARDASAKIVMAILTACLFGLINLVMLDQGIQWLVLAVGVVAATDSAAYFGGRAIGGPKLAPMISPSKTWSGAICGVVAGGVAGYVIGGLFGFSPSISALAGLFIADLSIGGDLLESWFKRRHHVKDSSQLLPGHGGFLDRFDGYLLVVPFLYLALINGLSQAGAAYGG